MKKKLKITITKTSVRFEANKNSHSGSYPYKSARKLLEYLGAIIIFNSDCTINIIDERNKSEDNTL